MWISDFTQGSRTDSRLPARVKGLARVARAIVSTTLTLLILFAGVLLPQFWEESTAASPRDERTVTEPIYQLSLSEGDNLLAVRTMKTVLIRDLDTGALIQELPIGSDVAAGMAWIPKMQSLLVARHAGTIAEWRGKPGSLSQERVYSDHVHEVRAVAQANKSRFVATVSCDRICLWDFLEESIVANAPMDGVRATSLHFSPEDDLLLAGCDDGSLKLFHAGDLRLAASHRLASSPVIHARFVQGGRRIFAGDRSGRLSLIDSRTGKEILHRQSESGEIMTAAVSPDDRFVAVCGYDKTIRLRDLESLAEIACLAGHKLPVTTLQFSKNGDRLYSAGLDGTIRTWNTQTFAELDCYQGTLLHSDD